MLNISSSDDSIKTNDMKYISYISFKKRNTNNNKYRSNLHLITKFIQYLPFSDQNVYQDKNKFSKFSFKNFNKSDFVGLFYISKHVSNITFDSIRIFRFSNSSKNYVLPCITKSKDWNFIGKNNSRR